MLFYNALPKTAQDLPKSAKTASKRSGRAGADEENMDSLGARFERYTAALMEAVEVMATAAEALRVAGQAMADTAEALKEAAAKAQK